MIELYLVNLTRDLNAREFFDLSRYISNEKKNKIKGFIHHRDAQHSLLGDILARFAICHRTGCKNAEIVFGENEYGKPILLSHTGLHFNISHSGKWVVCAIDTAPIGIDVERIDKSGLEIAEHFFSKAEFQELLNVPLEIRNKTFYTMWTMKESYIKAEGTGLSTPLDSFTVSVHSNTVYKNGIVRKKVYNKQLDEEHVLALCVSTNCIKTVKIYNISYFIANATGVLSLNV